MDASKLEKSLTTTHRMTKWSNTHLSIVEFSESDSASSLSKVVPKGFCPRLKCYDRGEHVQANLHERFQRRAEGILQKASH